MEKEDKAFTRALSAGMMRLGTPAVVPDEPNPFRHVLRWGMEDRKGQNCRIVHQSGSLAQIEFEDGHKAYVNRQAIVRRK